ncbi:MAG: amidohydrolase family protein [Spirochaetaceae bacterium]|nr:amidohydrolase family protein [Spirochaetaceae bacterium]
MITIFWNFRIVDAQTDEIGTVITDSGKIIDVLLKNKKATASLKKYITDGHVLLDGGGSYILMPGFIDVHAHFRTPGYEQKECIESASLAASAGGFTTVVCMANTKPVTDNLEQAAAIKKRADLIGLVDLYPALSLTKKMEGKALSEMSRLEASLSLPAKRREAAVPYRPLLLSEDGRDVKSSGVFKQAFRTAAKLGIPVSCHCDIGGEDEGTERALKIGMAAGAHVHIAHVSSKNALKHIRKAKAELRGIPTLEEGRAWVSCEATPHHIALTEKDARTAGEQSFGKVMPPLRKQSDRRAVIDAIFDGTIDIIATDHAPHTMDDKEKGAPGFSGMETAFAVCHQTLTLEHKLPLSRLSALLSYNPAMFLGLHDRGLIQTGLLADLVIVKDDEKWIFNAETSKSRGRNNLFTNTELTGKVLFTMRAHGSTITPLGCL